MSLLSVPTLGLTNGNGFPSSSSLALAPLPARRQPRSVRCDAASSDQGNNVGLTYADSAKLSTVSTDGTKTPGVLKPYPTPLPSPPSPPPHPVPIEPPFPEPLPVIGRSSFPAGFAFGASTSSLQIEGALTAGGRGPSIWEAMISRDPAKIADLSTPAVACNSFYRYKDDVKLLKDAGFDSYRFSIAWPRILPQGSLAGGVSKDGIRYYNNLIDELIANGIKPLVTLFHWDLPQGLDDAYGGFLDRRIVDDFKDFAEICFQHFGDRVKHWITLNEPHMFISLGYCSGQGAPGRCSASLGCPAGNSGTEPYIVAHHLILSHATVFRLYKEKFQGEQKGTIGITLDVQWYWPYCTSKQDINAQERAIDFEYGWFMDPIVYGDYPFIMRALVRERLPRFTEEEAKLIKGSLEFIGLNYYNAQYAYALPFTPNNLDPNYTTDSFVDGLDIKEGVPIGEPTRSDFFYSSPKGIFDLLLYTKQKYKNPKIYITENGCFDQDGGRFSFDEILNDDVRVKYYAFHLANVLEAIRLGVQVKGFFAWGLMDDWEWGNGYNWKLGITYVDRNDRENRYPKDSYRWFKKFLQT